MVAGSITARACRAPEEMLAAAGAISHYFGFRPDAAWLERWLTFFELDRMHAAFDGGAIVGGAGAFSLELTVPGGVVPAAGVSIVGVLPTHRRRGALTALMRAQLDDVRKRGEPVACLWASEETIYERFGYGLGVMAMEMTIPRERTRFRAPFSPVGPVRIVSTDEALAILPGIFDRVCARTAGMLSRSPAWWKNRRLFDSPDRRSGGGPLEHVVLEVDGKPEAYALYRMHHDHVHQGASKFDVLEAIGTTPEATRTLWRFLLDVDWMGSICARVLSTDHPLRLLLAEPRSAGFRVYDTLWIRLVDVGGALAARSFAGEASIVVDVRDAFCEWNAGRWTIGQGGAKRTDAGAEIALDVSDLGAVYLGGFSFRDLAEARRVDELRPGALARADAIFRTERPPYNAEMF